MTAESNFYSGKGVNYNLNGKYVTALEFAQMTEAVQDLQSAVGSESSGAIKDIEDLKTAVEALQTIVGDSSSGLVKRVSDLEAAAESAES